MEHVIDSKPKIVELDEFNKHLFEFIKIKETYLQTRSKYSLIRKKVYLLFTKEEDCFEFDGTSIYHKLDDLLEKNKERELIIVTAFASADGQFYCSKNSNEKYSDTNDFIYSGYIYSQNNLINVYDVSLNEAKTNDYEPHEFLQPNNGIKILFEYHEE